MVLNMKLALIGANGKVGTELCFLLKNEVEVIKPIIRNNLGAVFLKFHGFNCTIADIQEKYDAERNLSDVDVVLISSYATDPFTGSQTQSSKLINEKLIKNSVNYSKENATIIYFSTMRAFSHKLDPNTASFWTKPAYDKEKKHLEHILFSECKKRKKRGFALRIGYVFSKNQPKTRRVIEELSKRKVTVRVDPEKKSNVVHTPTIKNAILKCLDVNIKPGMYSVVNNPQWTWKDVFEYYKNEQTEIIYKPSTPERKNSSFLWKVLKSNKKYLSPLRYYMPSRYDKSIQQKLTIERMMTAISTLKEEELFYLDAFDYEPVPGPFLPGLDNTKELLKNYSLDIFDVESRTYENE